MSIPRPIVSTAPAATTGSYVGRVNFATARAVVAKRDATLSDDEWKIAESILREELKDNDGGRLVGDNPGALPAKAWAIFCSFVQSILSGKTDGILNTLNTSIENSAEHAKLFQLTTAMQHTYERLQQTKNPNLMAAAELLTGQTTDPSKLKAERVEGNVFNQILATLDRSKLPADLSISLNQQPPALALADAAPTSGLPAKVKPLTNAERGA